MWVFFGFGAIVTCILGFVACFTKKDAKYAAFISLAFTALVVCEFYSDVAARIEHKDWSGITDIVPGASDGMWFCVIVSILLNGISLSWGSWQKSRR